MIRRIFGVTFSAILSAIFCVGCGGSSGNEESYPQDEESAELLSGVFIDSPVEGLDYYAFPSGHVGITDVGGTFKYQRNDTEVTFKLEELEIGSAHPASVITPYDTSGVEGLINGKVGRTARLLHLPMLYLILLVPL